MGGKRIRGARGRGPFPRPLGVPAAPVVSEKGPENAQLDVFVTPLWVRGCLSLHWRQWQTIGAESWVVSVLRDGYRIPFLDSLPPLARSPVSFLTYWPGSPRDLALLQEVEKMLGKGALEIVTDRGPGFYSHLFLVEKATGGWRPAIDLSPLNGFVRQTPFTMETAASVLLSVREGDFLASMDLKDTYFQIPVHRSSRKWLWFTLEGMVYKFKVLCFGLSTAPQVLTTVFAGVSAWAHSRGIRLLRYLDDWLILASLEAKARQHVREMLSICHSLGIVINEEKSDLVPSQSAKYLCMTIDTVAARAFPTLARVEKFLSVAGQFLMLTDPPAQLWQVLLGDMSSLEKLVPHGRLRMRSLQWRLKSRWSAETDSPLLPVPWSREVDEDLSWWMVRDHLLMGMRFGPGEFTARQSPGNEGSVLGSAVIPGDSHRPSGDSNVRQLDSSGLCQQAGRDGLRLPLLVDRATSPMDRVPQCPSGGEIPAGTIQRSSGFPKPSKSSAGVRVVSPPASGEETHSHLGIPVAGLVRDSPQCETTPVLLSSPGSPGRLRGCLPSLLGRPGCIRVSSFSPSRESRGPGQRDPKSLDDSGHPSLARERVVRRPSSPPDPPTSCAFLVGPAVALASFQSVPHSEPSCVVTLKRLLRKSGFSRRAALEMSSCVRESTARLYQSQWLSFCGWCRGRGVAPVDDTNLDCGLSHSLA